MPAARSPVSAASRSRSMPSVSRRPISSASSASSARVSAVVFDDAVPAGLHQRRPALRIALRHGGLPRAVGDDAAVRSRPDAGVLAVAPVEQVVPALLARRGVVGDLVGRQARALGHLLRQLVEGARRLAIGHDELAARMQLGERRALLDGELVERQMRCPRAPAPRRAPRARRPWSGPAAHRSDRTRSDRMCGARPRSPRALPPTVCSRPSARSCTSSSDCTPSDTRLTPAAR